MSRPSANLLGMPLSREERRFFLDISIVVFLGLIAAEMCWPGFSTQLAGWPLVISLVFVGMPHGAVDLAVTKQFSTGNEPHRTAALASFGRYVAVLLFSACCFLVAPLLVSGLFFVLSAVHFGIADARMLSAREGGSTEQQIPWIALTRGVLLVALPFVFWPEASLQVVQDVVKIVRASGKMPSPIVLQAVASVLASAALLLLLLRGVAGVAKEKPLVSSSEWLETAVLLLAFIFFHPLFAIGLYVVMWHGWRHMLVVGRHFQGGRPLSSVKLCTDVVINIHVRSLPLLAPTIFIYFAIAWWRLDFWTVDRLAALMVAMFVVLTLPHHLLIERLFQSTGGQRTASVAG